MTYALDTNTIIFMLNKDEKVIENRNKAVLAGGRFIIPPIVDYEIQRGLLYRPSPSEIVLRLLQVVKHQISEGASTPTENVPPIEAGVLTQRPPPL